MVIALVKVATGCYIGAYCDRVEPIVEKCLITAHISHVNMPYFEGDEFYIKDTVVQIHLQS